VSRWQQQMNQGGVRALKLAGRTGRKPRLNEADRKRIIAELKRGPQALGTKPAYGPRGA